jgi:DNA-binding SARP family transcriptional activator/tetratricopeptide (TPR) repeat protein
MEGSLEFRILGPLEAWAGRTRIPLHGPRQEIVLATLIVDAGRTVTFDQLVDAVWDRPPPTARRQVQDLVTRLRRTLVAHGGPEDSITTHRPGYVLRVEPGTLDAERFEHLVRTGRQGAAADPDGSVAALRAALALCRGPTLAGITSRALRPAVARWEETRLAVREELLALELALGGHHALVGELAALVAEHPDRERPLELLMLSLHRAGRSPEALAAYRRFRQHLAHGEGLDPGPALQDLHRAILRADPVLDLDAAADPGEAASPARPPNQLPATIVDFVGRDKELQQLRALLTERAAGPGACVIVSVSGMAGVGKTALAVRAGQDLYGQFPGGCLYADLGGDAPADPLAVLGSFLRAYGIASQTLPDGLDERAALYRSVVAGRRVLVVLDDAAAERQVRPLLPGGDAAVLVTSRHPLAGLAGVRLMPLETLPVPDGLALLAKVAGRERLAGTQRSAGGERSAVPARAAERLVALCGNLPLAIRVAGVRLAVQDSLTAQALAAQLEDERRRLDELSIADLDVRASIELSCRRLPPGLARLFGLLCLLPLDSYAAWLADALLDAAPATARPRLEELREAQLSSPAGPERYRLHDLIRLHGSERIRAAEPRAARRAAVERAYGALLDRVRAANQRLPCRPIPVSAPGAPVPEPVPDPVAWFEIERDNVLRAIEHSARLGRLDLAGRLASSMVNFWMLRGYVDDWDRAYRVVLDAGAIQELAAPDEAALRLGYGTLLRYRDRNREALPHLRRAYRRYRSCDDNQGAAVAATSWSIAANLLGRTRIADAALTVALRLFDAIATPTPGAGYALLARHFDASEQGLAAIEQALKIFTVLDERWGEAEAHTTLGARLSDLGRPDEAASHLRRSAAIYRSLGDRLNQTEAELYLARVHLRAGATEQANHLVDGALRTSRALHHSRGEATALRLLGQLCLARGRVLQARSYL